MNEAVLIVRACRFSTLAGYLNDCLLDRVQDVDYFSATHFGAGLVAVAVLVEPPSE